MNTKQAYKKLHEKGFTMEEIQACWKEMENMGIDFMEFRRLMRVLAAEPGYHKIKFPDVKVLGVKHEL